jgi:hypothetical protein
VSDRVVVDATRDAALEVLSCGEWVALDLEWSNPCDPGSEHDRAMRESDSLPTELAPSLPNTRRP